MVEVANELLQTISDRLEHIETGLASVRAKTDRIDAIENDLASVRAKTDRIDAIESDLASVRSKIDAIELDVSAVRVRTDAQPDMRLLFQNVKLILERMVTMERDLVMLRSAFNDYGRENVTPGGIQAIHQALDTLREADLDREARLRVLEAHLPR